MPAGRASSSASHWMVVKRRGDAHLEMRTAAEKMARLSRSGLMLSFLSSLPGTPSRTSWMRIMTCVHRTAWSAELDEEDVQGRGGRTRSAVEETLAVGNLRFCTSDVSEVGLYTGLETRVSAPCCTSGGPVWRSGESAGDEPKSVRTRTHTLLALTEPVRAELGRRRERLEEGAHVALERHVLEREERVVRQVELAHDLRAQRQLEKVSRPVALLTSSREVDARRRTLRGEAESQSSPYRTQRGGERDARVALSSSSLWSTTPLSTSSLIASRQISSSLVSGDVLPGPMA